MTTVAEVKLWGKTIGAVALSDAQQYIGDITSFQYDADFVRSGIQVSPIIMPLSHQIYQFPALSRGTFHGLPGLLADSLPDKFGNILIDAWLSTQGRSAHSFNAIERLCYTGTRGMGALTFAPAMAATTAATKIIEIDRLINLASDILSERNHLKTSFKGGADESALTEILQVGTSAGGARAKAVIAWNPKTNVVKSGQIDTEDGFEYWLIKFDGVSDNGDKELNDPKGYGAIEYCYYHMATDAGINMSPCRLLQENGRRHFMTQRFDRVGTQKLHMQSLGAMAHFDYNQAGAYSYEQAMQVMHRIGLPLADVEQQFRRMVFNILARNQDDHVKNIAFLMNKQGQWSLSPAFDITYSYQPTGQWTSLHQMTLNGKRDNFTLSDFVACEKTMSLKKGSAKRIIREVAQVVANFGDYADEAGVLPTHRDRIMPTLRAQLGGGL